MDLEKRNRYILIITVIVMLFIVLANGIYLSLKNTKDESDVKVKINQIYSSEYDIVVLGDQYYLGLFDDKIHAIINSDGKEVYKTDEGISGAKWFKNKDDNYIIYTNNNDKLKIYLFDGIEFNLINSYDTEDSVKPVLYVNNEDKYIVSLVSSYDNNLVLYDLYDNNSIILEDTLLLTDYIKDNVYYTNNDDYLVTMKDNKVGCIDFNGNTIIDYQYDNLLSTDNDSFIGVNNKKLYGVIDTDNNVLIDFKYNAINYFDNYYVVVNNKNKMALFDGEYKNVTGFTMDYNSLLEFSLKEANNSFKMYVLDNSIVLLNNYGEDFYKTEYDKHNLYVISDGKVINTINQIGFGITNLIYSYDKEYNVVIYNDYMIPIGNFKIDDVSKINSIKYINDKDIVVDCVSLNGVAKKIYYNSKYDVISFKYGDLVFTSSDYYVYLNNDEITVTDKNDNVISSKKCDNVIVNGDELIIDNEIYLIKES